MACDTRVNARDNGACPSCQGTDYTLRPCRLYPLKHGNVCSSHGGASPNAKKARQKAAQTELAAAAVVTFGLPRTIDPHTALLEEVHRTAGHVAYLGEIVAQLEPTYGENNTSLLAPIGDSQSGLIRVGASIWVQMYQAERAHLVRVCAEAIKCGIAERQVKLAEEQGALIAQVLRGVIADLGLADDERVPAIVRRHLALVSG